MASPVALAPEATSRKRKRQLGKTFRRLRFRLVSSFRLVCVLPDGCYFPPGTGGAGGDVAGSGSCGPLSIGFGAPTSGAAADGVAGGGGGITPLAAGEIGPDGAGSAGASGVAIMGAGMLGGGTAIGSAAPDRLTGDTGAGVADFGDVGTGAITSGAAPPTGAGEVVSFMMGSASCPTVVGAAPLT